MGATTTTVVGCGVVALLVVLWVALRRATAERARRERLEQELLQSRADVTALGRRLDDLGHEVRQARSAADRSAQLASRTEREFVITSLADADAARPRRHAGSRRTGSLLEEKLVRAA